VSEIAAALSDGGGLYSSESNPPSRNYLNSLKKKVEAG
jgi:hypothetical protein